MHIQKRFLLASKSCMRERSRELQHREYSRCMRKQAANEVGCAWELNVILQPASKIKCAWHSIDKLNGEMATVSYSLYGRVVWLELHPHMNGRFVFIAWAYFIQV